MKNNGDKVKKVIADRFEIKQSLGRGGFSEVFLAYDRKLGREVALKQLFGSLEDEAFKKQREREIRIHSQLKSKHVISLHDSVVEDNTLYIVLDLMNRSLGNYTKAVKLNQVLAWVRECLLGLHDIHSQEIIHRDIKPSNIFIDDTGAVRIGDFGVARSKVSDSLPAWSPQYTSPELIHGDQEKVGPPSDLYALGQVIYQLLLGDQGIREAFPEVYEGLDREEALKGRWMLWHMNSERRAPSLHSIKSGISVEISDWVSKLVEKDPADRYQSAKEALEELAAITGEVVEVDRGDHEKIQEKDDKPRKTKTSMLRKVIYITGAVVVLMFLILIIIGLTTPEHTTIIVKPDNEDDIVLSWNGLNVDPVDETLRFKVEPSDSNVLRIFKGTAMLMDTMIFAEAGEELTIDLGPAIVSYNSASELLRLLRKPKDTSGAGLELILTSAENASQRIPMDVIKIGRDRMVYWVNSELHGHLMLLEINPDGELFVLFPNRLMPRFNTGIQSGMWIRVPHAGSFEVVGPVGSEAALAFSFDTQFSSDLDILLNQLREIMELDNLRVARLDGYTKPTAIEFSRSLSAFLKENPGLWARKFISYRVEQVH